MHWKETNMSDYHTESDPNLLGFNRFYSDVSNFPISISYPRDLSVNLDLYNEKGLAVSFDEGSSWYIAVTRWDNSNDYAFRPFSQGREDIFWYVKQDMEILKSWNKPQYGLTGIEAVKYWIDDNGIVGNPATSVPRARWRNPQGQVGQRVYIQRRVDPHAVVWTITRHPVAESIVPENVFLKLLQSFRFTG
jgi:hypothetical protein